MTLWRSTSRERASVPNERWRMSRRDRARTPGDEKEPRMPMFRVDLIPRSCAPLSFVDPEWEELDMNRRVGFPTSAPGRIDFA